MNRDQRRKMKRGESRLRRAGCKCSLCDQTAVAMIVGEEFADFGEGLGFLCADCMELRGDAVAKFREAKVG